MNDQKLMQNLDKYIQEKDILHADQDKANQTKVVEYLLTSLESSRDIQSGLYSNSTKEGGTIRRFKNIIITKLANIVRNVVELSFMRQQKFNDNVYTLLDFLIKENVVLKAEITNLKGNSRNDK